MLRTHPPSARAKDKSVHWHGSGQGGTGPEGKTRKVLSERPRGLWGYYRVFPEKVIKWLGGESMESGRQDA